MSGTESEHDRLRQRVADAGIPLFRVARIAPDRGAGTDGAKLAALLRDLVTCDDPRLVAAIPCLLMTAEHRGPALAAVAASLRGASLRRLGVIHRVARALAISREPDLRQMFGAAPQMTPLACEPSDLPDPLDDHGEELLRELRDPQTCAGAEWGTLAGDMEDTFDTWLRLAHAPGVCRA